eukprot:gnl/MRDRNA2_/MRDRNA2_81965_c0_seq7.p1 gnl/MRDRNA2_/MRDRNA2_81965_c0~~gnl/MRDRNA2_/MRDRNA2_81965_c0_seq7.p1  ORF type:complete len:203 (+),score=31.25 gnl/MRDRNA2_/MRDRNA2_81965_c0_seq7:209-817(+)
MFRLVLTFSSFSFESLCWGVALVSDLECADVFLFRSKAPINCGGALIFVDGESAPHKTGYDDLMEKHPASVVLGPTGANGESNMANHMVVPYVSTSFASREEHTPADLSRTLRELPTGKSRFAAYLAYRCWPHREDFFRKLVAAAKTHGLGAVDALGNCDGTAGGGKGSVKTSRYSSNWLDEAVRLYEPYKFVLVFENEQGG